MEPYFLLNELSMLEICKFDSYYRALMGNLRPADLTMQYLLSSPVFIGTRQIDCSLLTLGKMCQGQQ